MKPINQNLIVTGGMVATVLGLLFGTLGCKQPIRAMAEEAGAKVEGEKVVYPSGAPQLVSLLAQPAETRVFAVTHLTGRLYWNDETTVRIFSPVSGRVTRVQADVGDVVKAGAPLVAIDSPDFNQALSSARTSAGNLIMAEKSQARAKDLLAHGAAAQKDVEAAEAAYVAAQAERDRAEAVLANYGGSSSGASPVYSLRTPLSGVVVEKNVNPGQELRADLMLANSPSLFVPQFVVTDPTELWLQVDVAESDLALLQKGLSLRVRSRAYPDKVFEGVISKVGESMDPATRTVKVRGVVKNPDGFLKSEMYVQVDILQEASRLTQVGVEIPSKSVFVKGNDSFLFVETNPGTFERRKVNLGTEKDGVVPVFEGVKAGDKVVVEGALLLQAVLEPRG